jgi:hypothetical protein
MSDERGLVGTIVDNVGDTYQQILWNPGGPAPVAETPDFIISPPDISGPEIAAPEPMSGAQLQTLVDINNHEAEVAAYDAAGIDTAPSADIGPPGDMGMDYTPSDAPIVAEDYEPQAAAIEAPDIAGPDISGPEIGPSEGPDMG